MQTITKYLVLLGLILNVQLISAQDTIQNVNNKDEIETLKEVKEQIKNEERNLLKAEVEAINIRLEKGELSNSEAEILKKEVAKKRALNIENRIAIINNKISLLQRNEEGYDYLEKKGDRAIIRIGRSDDETKDSFIFIGEEDDDKPKKAKYDRRTVSHLVFGIGFNNAIIENQKIDDSPYKLAGSGFVELGWAWKTRLLTNSNAVRLKYGFSFTWNKLDIKDNKYLVNNNGSIDLEDFPSEINKAKFRTTNLIFPVHFEFGPSKRKDRGSYFRYSTKNQFKLGLGGFAGFNLQNIQKLKYNQDGEKVKDKIKGGYNSTDFVYGLSGYLAFGSTALYVKYDLSPLFKNQIIEQNNISVGLRFDMD